MKANKASKMHPRKNGRRIREYLVWREDSEGHAKSLQIFVGLDTVYVAPEGIISKSGIMMIKVNNNCNLSTHFEAGTRIDAL